MKISEIFYSIQGEGRLAGVPSVFVRISGCPLRCRWCDTKYAWDGDTGTEYSIEQIIQQVCRYGCGFVVITGGEPLLNPQLPELTRRLKAGKKHITIETAGVKFAAGIECDLMSISPKLSNSAPLEAAAAARHRAECLNVAAIKGLIAAGDYQLKFVVDSPNDDIDEIEGVLGEIGGIDRGKVMLMAQGVTRAEILEKSPIVAQICTENGLVFSPRLHILLWDNEKGR